MFLKKIFYASLLPTCLLAIQTNFELRNLTNQVIYYSIARKGVNIMTMPLRELGQMSSDTDAIDFAELPEIYLLPKKTPGTQGRIYNLSNTAGLASRTIFAIVEKDKEGLLLLKPNPGLLRSVEIGIAGTAYLNLPLVGNLDAAIIGELSAVDPLLSGSVGGFSYENFNLNEASVMVRPKKKLYEIIAQATYKDLIARVSLIRDIQNQVSLTGSFNKEFKPFKDVAALKSLDIALLSGAFGITRKLGDKANTRINLTGESRILGQKFIAGAILPLGSGPIALFAETPVNWKLSETFKGMPKIFDNLTMTNGKIIVASEQIYDATKKNYIPGGITIQGDFQDYKVTEDAGVRDLVGNANASVGVTVPVTSFRDTQINVTFDGEIPGLSAGDIIKGGGLSLILTGRPSAIMSFNLKVALTKGDDPVVFKFAPELSPDTVKIEGAMVGCYNNAFKIPGFNMCDLSLNINLNIPQFLVTKLPSGFGLGGKFDLAPNKVVILKGNFDTTKPHETYLVGELRGELTIKDIINVCQKMLDNVLKGKRIQSDDIPDLALRDVEYRVVPIGKAVAVGRESYDPGLTMKGTLRILGHETVILANIGYTGLIFECYFKTLKLGDWVTISGAGPDLKYGTADDGVYCSVAATLEKQHVYFSGMLDIKNILKSQTEVRLSVKEGFSFTTTTKLFGDLFWGSLSAKTGGSWKNPQFEIDILFHNDLNEYIGNKIMDELKKIQKKFDEAAAKANKALDDAVRELNRQRGEAQRLISNAKANVKREFDAATAKLKSVEREYDAMKRKWDGLSDLEKSFRWVDVGIPLGALKVAYETANAFVNEIGRKVANLTLDASAKAAEDLLNASKDVVNVAARQVATGVLKGTSVVVYESGKFVAKNIINAFVLRELRFTGKLSEIIDLKLPRLEVTFTLFGQKQPKIAMQLDFKQLARSAENIATNFGRMIEKAFKI